MGLSLPFPRQTAISVKNSNFPPHPCILRPAERFPLELGNTGRPQKTRMTWLPGQERNVRISSAECDGRTDRETDTGRQLVPRLHIASSGKNRSNIILYDEMHIGITHSRRYK